MGINLKKAVGTVKQSVTNPIAAVKTLVTPPKSPVSPSATSGGGGILGKVTTAVKKAAPVSVAKVAAPISAPITKASGGNFSSAVKKALTNPLGTTTAAIKTQTDVVKNSLSDPLGTLKKSIVNPVGATKDAIGTVVDTVRSPAQALEDRGLVPKTPADYIKTATAPITYGQSLNIPDTTITSINKPPAGQESAKSAWAGFKEFSDNVPSPSMRPLEGVSLPENMQVKPTNITAGTLTAPTEIKAPDRQYTGFSGGQNLAALGELGRGTTSPWEKLALEKQGLEQQNAYDASARQAAGSIAGARAGLAMRGGLTGGAATSLAKAGMAQQNAAMSNVNQQGALDRLGIQSEAAKQRQSALTSAADLESNIGMSEAERSLKGGIADQATGLDVAKTNTATALDVNRFNINTGLDVSKANAAQNMASQQFNVGNTLGEAANQRNFDLDVFKQKMAGYGAEKTGQAIAKGGKK